MKRLHWDQARRALAALLGVLLLWSLQSDVMAGSAVGGHGPAQDRFTIAVIPDTQNMLDYRHQRGQDLGEFGEFPFDASEQFIGMLQYIADNSVGNGGDIVFAAAVGDVWQHQSILIDDDHLQRGFDHTRFSPVALSGEIHFTEETRREEIPRAIEGYRALARAGLPFGVAPGNHDYDAMWADDSEYGNLFKAFFSETVAMDPEVLGVLHIGGLDNFRTAFGSDTEFFRDKDWYVASHDGGSSAAQVFSAAGYRFLHITLEMSPPDEVLAWAQEVIDSHPGYPTIITTHDYLDTHGERAANPLVDLAALDPERHNSAEQMYRKLIHPNDQVFLVLCGHHHGQAVRIDANEAGNQVMQVLADYQDRGQSLLDVNPAIVDGHGRQIGIGDGWLRLMTFDFSSERPRLVVRTYSSHYRGFSTELEGYSDWYRAQEKPGASDAEFLLADEFELELLDFYQRFQRTWGLATTPAGSPAP